jgi:CheY-like chemotaxis protein
MNALKIGLCYYPTSTVLVDDNDDFLERISKLLKEHLIPCKYYSDPIDALDYLNKEYKPDPFTNRCITTAKDRDIDTVVSHFDFRKIHHEIYNPKRFEQVSVLAIDYAMPTLHGLDFCRKAEETFSQRLIFTGEAGHSLAVEAFNEGIIHKFLRKGEVNLPDLLLEDIQNLQGSYFRKLSEIALHKASKDLFKHAPECLRDPEFVKLLHQICKKHNIVEYYLLDEHGSFLLLDEKGIPSWLIVKSEKDMQDVYQYAQDQEAPKDILDLIKERIKVP